MNIDEYLVDYKIISDVIHGSIGLSKLAILIIDTPEFQRLRYIKQLSTCYFAFPNAIHSRFEHSIGTYHICKEMLYSIKSKSKISELDIIKDIPELQNYYNSYNITSDYLTKFIIELVAIAALCHDLGHAAFSHLFDDYFIKNIKIDEEKQKYTHHEHRSCILLEHIIKNNSVLDIIIDYNLMKFIYNIINPDPQIHTGYIYQIVSNNLNSIDVDKFDYLTRDSKMLGINISFNYNRLIDNAMVINNIICYPKKLDSDVINLFMMRHYMHKKIYSHKTVIASLLLINDLLILMNEYLNFIDNIDNLSKFTMITDDYIMNLGRFYSQTDDRLKIIFERLDKHNFYNLIFYTYLEPSETITNILHKYIDENKNNNNDNDIIYFENIIGFISGKKKNPLENVVLYETKNPYNKLTNLLQSESNKLLPQNYQEKLVMLFSKEKH
jgi:HD superfamily phosphohydrolase